MVDTTEQEIADKRAALFKQYHDKVITSAAKGYTVSYIQDEMTKGFANDLMKHLHQTTGYHFERKSSFLFSPYIKCTHVRGS